MDSNILVRILIFGFALAVTCAVIILTQIPKRKLWQIISLSWIAGILNLLVDIPQQILGFWRYHDNLLWLGLFPLDLYLAVIIGVGVGLVTLAWYIAQHHPKSIRWFIVIVPVYFYLQDMIFISLSDDIFVQITSTTAYISDLAGVSIITLGTLFLTRKVWTSQR